ncbi:TonB-dependent receptor, partial [Muribaculum caecicola]
GINWLPIKKLDIGADIKGISRLFVADSQPLESFAIANIKAEYKLFKQLTLMLRLENITDARYEINRGYRMPGFTAIGGFRLSLSTNR